MRDDTALETLSAMLCLLTRAAWEPELPPPMTRPAVRRLLESGALSGLVLREVSQAEGPMLERASALLARAMRVCELAERYAAAGYAAMTPEDGRWPEALRALGRQMPLFLFAKGNASLLNQACIAVAGSREIAPETRRMARRIGSRLAAEGYTLVTGGARGVDAASLQGALEAGGSAILVPAKPAQRMLDSAGSRRAMEEGRLLILCDTLPDEPFSAAKAIARNHTLYALGEAAIVAAARRGMGGSWRGATDCLRGGWSPVYAVQGGGEDAEGNRALLERGAKPIFADRPLGAQLTPAFRQMCMLDESPHMNQSPHRDEGRGARG
ncbi:MAG: DNA-processing protein DprA [Clostridia bacterium]|nr:DNA-processing protein DprA [Clostridia bacterium]